MRPLEANTRSNFDQILINLNYIIDETNELCNVFKEQPKTEEQKKRLGRKRADYIIYESNTDNPLAVVEAKKIGEDIEKASSQAIEYARCIKAPLAFVTNDTNILGFDVISNNVLKIDNMPLQRFVDESLLLRFIQEGDDLISKPISEKLNKAEILNIFKKINDLLRKEGLRTGHERFSAISDLLFLKLLSEDSNLGEYTGNTAMHIGKKYSWEELKKQDDNNLVDFFNDIVRPRLIKRYGAIFENQFTIKKDSILRKIIELLDPINLSKANSDIKGDAFEYFLKNLTNGNKDLGEYYTPRHIIQSIIGVLDPKYGEKIYDPFCGTGGFLIEAFKYLTLKSDMSNPDIRKFIKSKSLYGSEISSTARIAKMNMILFGDGSTNIYQQDTLENPKKNKYDIVLSNIPYSQKTDYGALYKLDTDNADAVCVKHMWDALKDGGRMAVVVPETFLYEEGIIKLLREHIYFNSDEITIISLPRGVFNPYTPTKTSVIIVKKHHNNKPEGIYFKVIDNDGFELGARRRPLKKASDLTNLKNNIEEKCNDLPNNYYYKGDLNDNFSFLPFDYFEDVPKEIKNNNVSLSNEIIALPKKKLKDLDDIKQIAILTISQNGTFLKELTEDYEDYMNHTIVKKGDIIYNPHRINVGSIGSVTLNYDIMVVSPIYEIFKLKNLDHNYLVSLLKTKTYLQVIEHYTKGGARPTLKIEDLGKIKVPKLGQHEIEEHRKITLKIESLLEQIENLESGFNLNI
ncbi:N-6 DNA methylase [Staphylococcus pseudintermedius]|uniref:N-6 DNA methylase n=1 Tax=Staphylococcus pseudintermedius TaxID=283734 RepID=UPI00297240EF|nr:N-6 DNA methylase [Staphylococcus pseudintermedius]WQJ34037.1 N-6 DNA methylase [Staphylococcus pseudintermedius]WQL14268.1 N-6 DNA methylase [Staphylococcus pseudintermedius]WQL29943.1 N-6 DNA methylase [Staphylococcus pseudintermedius]HAR6191298.1 N-6 DNA methylase [Staphylococcus pseudintermedius]